MRKTILIFSLILLVSFASAISLDVEKVSSNDVYVRELGRPTEIVLQMKNFGDSDDFQIYNMVGWDLTPGETVYLKKGEIKNVTLELAPIDEIDYKGFYIMELFIRGSDDSQISRKVTLKIIDLGDAFEIGANELDPEKNSIEIYLKNKENFDFEKVNVDFNSEFFDLKEEIFLGPKEKVSFEIELDKEEFKELFAGFYTLDAKIETFGESANVEGVIRFLEKDLLETSEEDYGFLIRTKVIEKENLGNIVVSDSSIVEKGIISRLFTTFTVEPDSVTREGGDVTYVWNHELNPGEKIVIKAKTNWIYPILILALLILIVYFVKKYSRKDLNLSKRVSFVKAKGGEFGLKISLIVKANEYLEDVKVVDRLPPLAKLYERFGMERPSKINEKSRRIEWDFKVLEKGERRVITYLVYSKVGVLGKFALPTATAFFKRDGKLGDARSNRAYFVSEQKEKYVQ